MSSAVSVFSTATNTRRPRGMAPVTCPPTLTLARATRWMTARIGYGGGSGGVG